MNDTRRTARATPLFSRYHDSRRTARETTGGEASGQSARQHSHDSGDPSQAALKTVQTLSVAQSPAKRSSTADSLEISVEGKLPAALGTHLLRAQTFVTPPAVTPKKPAAVRKLMLRPGVHSVKSCTSSPTRWAWTAPPKSATGTMRVLIMLACLWSLMLRVVGGRLLVESTIRVSAQRRPRDLFLFELKWPNQELRSF